MVDCCLFCRAVITYLDIAKMRLGRETNGCSFEMAIQDAFEKWLISKGLKYIREITVKEVSRRADFIVMKDDSRLINVEAKCNNMSGVIEQVTDHARYCDYCFLLLSDIALIPKWMIRAIRDGGFGLIVYNYKNETITEALPAFYNKGRDGKLHKKYIEKIKEKGGQLLCLN